jgi:hypothetical protein
MSRATRNARLSSSSFRGGNAPTKFVSALLGRLTSSSQWMLLSCFNPSPIPAATWVESPSSLLVFARHHPRERGVMSLGLIAKAARDAGSSAR